MAHVYCQRDRSFLFNTYMAVGRFYFHRWLWSLGEVCALHQQDRKTTRFCTAAVGSKHVTLSYNKTGKPERLCRASAQLGSGFRRCQIWVEWKQSAKTLRRLLVGCAGLGASKVRLSPLAVSPRAGGICFPAVPVLCSAGSGAGAEDGPVKQGGMW